MLNAAAANDRSGLTASDSAAIYDAQAKQSHWLHAAGGVEQLCVITEIISIITVDSKDMPNVHVGPDSRSRWDARRRSWRRHAARAVCGFLRESVGSIGAVRDYVEACTKSKGAQYDHALQDLVNHTGSLIGFKVEYGRYKGVSNDVGHDGNLRWDQFSIVVEVKTTDAFSIQTATLVGYVDKLISKAAIPNWDRAMGLCVFGRTDSQLKQLANSIVAEMRTHQLRIATVNDVLSLAELVEEKHITADEAVMLLKPGGVFVADTVELLARIAAQATVPQTIETTSADAVPTITEPAATFKIETTAPNLPLPSKPKPTAPASTDRLYIMTPVRRPRRRDDCKGHHRRASQCRLVRVRRQNTRPQEAQAGRPHLLL